MKYRNPILFADYSDPDVIRVGDTFYMTASSFNYTPGLPILISKDLVNWELVNYALKNIGQKRFEIPRHSEGVWAPAIRYHEGMFYIYYGMPDEGYYVVRTLDPLGEWEEPVCILKGKGLIDSCPFWDEDGRAYVIHGYAKSRIGFKSILGIFEMSPDGLKAISEDHFIFDGNDPKHPAVTIEGPKIYKRNGYYYIWAPAGGVREGYQVVLRSRNIHGPYEIRTVMHQGNTVINGPHQGGLVDTINGDEWFIHFQDRGLYGRICHLQPVKWDVDWPVIGNDIEGTGCGEPVYEYEQPDNEEKELSKADTYFPSFGECEIYRLPENIWGDKKSSTLHASDSFPEGSIGLQWQWMGDHRDSFFDKITDDIGNVRDGLRLFCQNPSGDPEPTIWRSANVLTQKLIYPAFEASISMDATGLTTGDRAGVVMTGGQYVSAFIEKDEKGNYHIKTIHSVGSDKDKKEVVDLDTDFWKHLYDNGLSLEEGLKRIKWIMSFTCKDDSLLSKDMYFQNVKCEPGKEMSLKIYLSFDGVKVSGADESTEPLLIDLGVDYTPSDHTWVGAKLGIYSISHDIDSQGYADFNGVKYSH